MKRYTHRVAGDEVVINYVENDDDVPAFRDWAARPRRALAVDTETTGLDILSRDSVRLVQFGDCREAWVLPCHDDGHESDHAIIDVLHSAPALAFHNATFDLLALDRLGLVTLEDAYERSIDTGILSHLLDPRARSEGGVGHGLKELCTVYVDSEAADSRTELKSVFRENKWKEADGYRLIPADHPTYVTYAGYDTILTARLLEVLGPAVQRSGMGKLVDFEHEVSALLARMERRGILLDVLYTEGLLDYFAAERTEGLAEAAKWGVSNVESTAQVAEAFKAMGIDLTEQTPTGKPKVDHAILLDLAENKGNPLAAAVLKAKRAAKYRKAYAKAMLDLRDDNDRVHAKLNALQARTARMSVSRPPLQQLPSGDWRIRRALVADPGHVVIACDYSQVELRVLFALAQDKAGLQAIADGKDLHDATAEILFGPDFTKAQRKLAKNTGFGRVYGGGAKTLARQAGVDLPTAKAAMDAYDRGFPGVKRYSKSLVDKVYATGDRSVTTPSGRVLPLDGDRLYAATNYTVQSAARDVIAQALLELDDAGLGDHLLLPVHDEILAQAPATEAHDVAHEIGKVMAMDFLGVPLEATADVYGPSWGHGYGASD